MCFGDVFDARMLYRGVCAEIALINRFQPARIEVGVWDEVDVERRRGGDAQCDD